MSDPTRTGNHAQLYDRNPSHETRNGMAIAGFVCSLASLLILWFTVVLPVLGIIFSLKGIRKADEEGAGYRGLAKAGVILGVISAVLEAALILWWIAA